MRATPCLPVNRHYQCVLAALRWMLRSSGVPAASRAHLVYRMRLRVMEHTLAAVEASASGTPPTTRMRSRTHTRLRTRAGVRCCVLHRVWSH